jgi:hypothetical protein
MKPVLKAHGTERLKRNCHELLSSFAFRFNLRRYTEEVMRVELEAASDEKVRLESLARAGAIAELGETLRAEAGGLLRISTRPTLNPQTNGSVSVYRLGEMPIQSYGQSGSAPRGKASAMLNAHTELRAERQRSTRGAIYRNRPFPRVCMSIHLKGESPSDLGSSACSH